MSTFDRILGTAILAAEKAGQVARDVLEGGNLGIVEKSGGADDLQTAADRAANRMILLSLRRAVPGLRVIGEEGQEEPTSSAADGDDGDGLAEASESHGIAGRIPEEYRKAALEDFTVWVDPLDATKEYSEGFLHHVTVLVGIALKDKAVAGVIHQPFFEAAGKKGRQGRTIFGVVGAEQPAVMGRLPAADRRPEVVGSRICTTSRSHNNRLVELALEAVKPTEVIRVGGAGYKVLLLIEGTAGAYIFPSPGCKKWDTCAPEAVLHACGGKLTDIKGRAYAYGPDAPVPDEWGVLATARAQDHDEYLNAIPETVKEAVKSYGLKK